MNRVRDDRSIQFQQQADAATGGLAIARSPVAWTPQAVDDLADIRAILGLNNVTARMVYPQIHGAPANRTSARGARTLALRRGRRVIVVTSFQGAELPTKSRRAGSVALTSVCVERRHPNTSATSARLKTMKPPGSGQDSHPTRGQPISEFASTHPSNNQAPRRPAGVPERLAITGKSASPMSASPVHSPRP